MKPYRIGIGVSKISVCHIKSCCNYQKLQYKGILLSDLVISPRPGTDVTKNQEVKHA